MAGLSPTLMFDLIEPVWDRPLFHAHAEGYPTALQAVTSACHFLQPVRPDGNGSDIACRHRIPIFEDLLTDAKRDLDNHGANADGVRPDDELHLRLTLFFDLE